MNDESSNEALSVARQFLSQDDVRHELTTAVEGPWTTLWEDWQSDDGKSGGRYCALSDPGHREEVLRDSSWDLREGEGLPGFSQSFHGGVPETEYYRFNCDEGFEPLLIIREMHGMVLDEFIISQEFQLLMRLSEDKESGHFYSHSCDGSRELVIEIGPRSIKVRTPILRRYQAARQKDVLLFVDSKRFVKGFDGEHLFAGLSRTDDAVDGDMVETFSVGTVGRSVFTRLLAKRVVPPPPREESGFWPWESEDDNFPEFIIGESSTGKSQRFTCDPDRTANYFGANPEAPHYLTPVFFRKEVLQRYYDDPRYVVTAGRLSFGSLWGVQIDNHSPNFVMVFLGDIGCDIPASHRDHWRAHNIPSTSAMSEATFRQSFLAQFADTPNPEHIFKRAYVKLTDIWTERAGWPLFRQPYGSDADALTRIRIPLNETDAEFEGQLLLLCKLIVDLLNEREMIRNLPKLQDEKGLGKLERYLTQEGYAFVQRDMAFLRRVQKLRSKVTAHAKGSDYESYIRGELSGRSKSDLITELMMDATLMADGLISFART